MLHRRKIFSETLPDINFANLNISHFDILKLDNSKCRSFGALIPFIMSSIHITFLIHGKIDMNTSMFFEYTLTILQFVFKSCNSLCPDKSRTVAMEFNSDTMILIFLIDNVFEICCNNAKGDGFKLE